MKETRDDDGKSVNLTRFLELKPQLGEGILNKLEGVVQKLLDKGLARLSIV
jgi:hypothetical protein